MSSRGASHRNQRGHRWRCCNGHWRKEQLEQMCAEPHESRCVKGRESAGSCFLSSPLLLLFHLRRVDCGWPPSLYLILQLLCATWLLWQCLGYCCCRSAAVECSQYRIAIIYSVFSSLVHNAMNSFSCFYWLEAELGQRNCLLWMLQNIFAFKFSQSRTGILATFNRILIICLLFFSVQEPFQLLSISSFSLFCSLVTEKPIMPNTAFWI